MKKQYYKLKLADVLLNEGIGEYSSDMNFSGNNDDVDFNGNSEQGLYFDDYIQDFMNSGNSIDDTEFKKIQLALNVILFTVDKQNDYQQQLNSFCKNNNIKREGLDEDIKVDKENLHKILTQWTEKIKKQNDLTIVVKTLHGDIKRFIPKSIIVKYLFLKFNDENFKNVINQKAIINNNFEKNNKIIKSDVGLDIVSAFYSALEKKKITSGEMGKMMSQELENDDSNVSFLTNIHQMFSMLLGPGADAMLKPLFQTVSKVYKEISSNKELNNDQKQEIINSALKPIGDLKQEVKAEQKLPTAQQIKTATAQLKRVKK